MCACVRPCLQERLAERFDAVKGPRQWRALASFLSQLGYSEKGLRGIVDRLPRYKHALGVDEVYQVFKVWPAHWCASG